MSPGRVSPGVLQRGVASEIGSLVNLMPFG